MKQSAAIDLMRLLIAFMVVAIHCGVSDFSENLYNVFQSLVCFFFVITGYFIESKPTEIRGGYVSSYISRSCKLYLHWSLIFLPLTIYGFIINGKPLWYDVLWAIRGYLIVGEQYCSWPLWYLLATIYAVAIYRYTLQKHWSTRKLILLTLSIATVGYLLEYTSQYRLVKGVLFLTGGTRNGLFQGFTFLVVGIMIKRLNLDAIKKSQYYLYCMLLVVVMTASSYLPVPRSLFLNHISCGLLMIILLNTNIKSRIDSRLYRELGIWIYFSHMYVLFFLSINGYNDFEKSIWIALPVTVAVCLVLMLSSQKFYWINKLIR